jgi:hypothetical protein
LINDSTSEEEVQRAQGKKQRQMAIEINYSQYYQTISRQPTSLYRLEENKGCTVAALKTVIYVPLLFTPSGLVNKVV